MTCLIGVHSPLGRIIVIADSCISWEIQSGTDKRYVYEDELEKFYKVGSGTICAICGCLLTSQKILKELRRMLALGGLPDSADTNERRASKICRHLKRRWEETSDRGRVHLLIIERDSLWKWSTDNPDKPEFIQPGTILIIGTLEHRSFESIREKLRQNLRGPLAHTGRRGPLDAGELANALSFVTNDFFRTNKVAGIGGLFRTVYLQNTGLATLCFNAAKYTDENGLEYEVELEETENGDVFQINHMNNSRIKVKQIDQHNFRRSTRIPNEFKY